jgi:hypothetical protein
MKYCRDREYNFLIIIGLLFLFIGGSASVYAQNAANLKIKKKHPFLFVSPDLIKNIETKKSDLKSFHEYVEKHLESNTNDPNDIKNIRLQVDERTIKDHVDYYINDASC